jgi:hypothetical protein
MLLRPTAWEAQVSMTNVQVLEVVVMKKHVLPEMHPHSQAQLQHLFAPQQLCFDI